MIPSISNLFGSEFNSFITAGAEYWSCGERKSFDKDVIEKSILSHQPDANSQLHIYIHVPYCSQKCLFCAFSQANNKSIASIPKYMSLLIRQLEIFLRMSNLYEYSITSIYIGGGSPDLLGSEINQLFKFLNELPGFDNDTELTFEFSLLTISDEVIKAVNESRTTKVSFGIQTFDPKLRKYLNLPENIHLLLDNVLGKIDGNIKVIDADLLTGLPGQSLEDSQIDLETIFRRYTRINSISSYPMTNYASAELMAKLIEGKIPYQAGQSEQIEMRLKSIENLNFRGWKRRGMLTFVNTHNFDAKAFLNLNGNEAFPTRNHRDACIGVGPGSFSYLPGLSITSTFDLQKWISQAECNTLAFDYANSFVTDLLDLEFWGFPMRHEGILKSSISNMIANKIIDDRQVETFYLLVQNGLISDQGEHFQLTETGLALFANVSLALRRHRDQKEYLLHMKRANKYALTRLNRGRK